MWETLTTRAVENLLDEGEAEEEGLPSSSNMPQAVSGVCCVVMNDHLYTFGGWAPGAYRTADVHELDFQTLNWQLLKSTNPGEGPFLKDKAGMVSYGKEMLCIFGGYGYPSEAHIVSGVYHLQKGAAYHWDENSLHRFCWTNELHVFHTVRCKSWPSACVYSII